MKKYQPVPLPKHWLTNKFDKKPFEFSSESVVGVLLGPLSLIYISPWLMLLLSVVDVSAIVMLNFVVVNKFYSLLLIFISLALLLANHYLCAWLRVWLLARRK